MTIANEEIIIKEISRLNLGPKEILVLHLPEIECSNADLASVKASLVAFLEEVGLDNACIVVRYGMKFEAITPHEKNG